MPRDTYHATQDEIISEVFLTVQAFLRLTDLFLPPQSLIAEHEVQLLDDVVLAALIIEQANVDACLGIVVAILLVKHHEQPAPVD